MANERKTDRSLPPGALLTVPNALSILRAGAGPLVMVMITNGSRMSLWLALVVMVIAEASDVVDGFVARNFDQESRLGSLIDPVCDSIYHLTVFLAFLSVGWIPAWMVYMIYARDLAVPYLRAFVRQTGRELQMRSSGKIKTAAHALAQIGVVLIALRVFGPDLSTTGTFATGLLIVATGASLYSLVDYAVEALRLAGR